MSLSIRCPQCRVVLNIPPEAGTRRLKCPRCGARFHAGPNPPSNPEHGHVGIPVAPGDLRETFDIPLLLDDDLPAGPRGRAETLFADDEDSPGRRAPPGGPRARPRPCPRCGHVVPAGWSLCGGCGLDLDEPDEPDEPPGPDDLLDEPPPPPPAPPAPVGVLVVGVGSLIVSVVLAILALVVFGGLGGAALAVVALFGAFASVQLLAGRSARPLVVALVLGGLIDILGLIVLPVYQANRSIPAAPAPDAPAADDLPAIPNLLDRLDTTKIQCGVLLLILAGALLIYLTTADIRRHFASRRQSAEELPDF